MLYQDLRLQKIDILPLTKLQQELFASIELGQCDYFEEVRVRFEQPVNPKFLTEALRFLAESQPALRTVFRMLSDGKPVQILLKDITLPFYLDRGPLVPDVGTEPWSLTLLSSERCLTLQYSHLVMDGWSMGVFWRQLLEGYQALSEQNAWQPSLQSSVRRLFETRKATRLDSEEEFWTATLQNIEPCLLAERVYCRNELAAENCFETLTDEDTRSLRAVAARFHVTPAVLFYAGWSILLSAFTGNRNVCEGIVLSGREIGGGEQNAIGMYIQTLPLAIEQKEELRDLCREIADFLSHKELHVFEAAEQALRSSGFSRFKDLFDTLVAVENYPLSPSALRDKCKALQPESYQYYERPSYPFTLQVRLGEAVELNLSTSREELKASLPIILNCLKGILQQIAQGDTCLKSLSLCGENAAIAPTGEQGPVMELSCPLILNDLIRSGCIAGGKRTAIREGNREITFSELLKRAECCACGLLEQGMELGQAVGVCMERGIDQLTAVYAIFLAGGIYVPFSASIPVSRANYMIEKANIHRMICHSLPACWQAEEVVFSRLCTAKKKRLPDIPQDSERTAYILFTSGTTGKPKGCEVSHAALYNRLQWNVNALGLDANQRQLYKTPVTFDVSLIEIFSLFTRQFTLCVLPEGQERMVDSIVQTIREEKITYLHFVPSMLHSFLEYLEEFHQISTLENVKKMVCSGEILPSSLVRELLKQNECQELELYNLYGPTETAVDVSCSRCDPQSETAETPIGYPIWNTELCVLDSWNRRLPTGVVGELHILGRNLGNGYVNDPELTAERFVTLPDEKRAYRTGDLAYWTQKEGLIVIGRSDDQVKFNGVRIETAEISDAMQASGLIHEAVCLIQKGYPDRLIAFYTAQIPCDDRLREALSKKLPATMLPSDYCCLSELPKSMHGKLDRKALLRLFSRQAESENPPVAQVDNVQVQMGAIWQKLLDTRRFFAPQDNFFACGGTSLMLVRMLVEIRRTWGVQLGSAQIYQAPTLEKLCTAVRDALKMTGDNEVKKPPALPKMNSAQKNIAAYQLANPESCAYNIPVSFSLHPHVNAEAVLNRLNEMLEAFDWLRVIYDPADDQYRPRVLPYQPLQPEKLSCSETELPEILDGFVRPFRIDKLMMRTAVVRTEECEHFLVDIHHLLCDQAVVHFLIESLLDLLEGKNLTARTEQSNWKQAPDNDAYWKENLEAGEGRVLDGIHPWNPEHARQLERLRFRLTEKESEAVYKAAKQYNVSSFQVLFAAFFLLVSRLCGRSSLTIGTSTTSDAVASDIMTLQILPIRLDLGKERGFREIVLALHHTFAQALAHGGTGLPGLFDTMFVREEPLFEGTRIQNWFRDLTPLNKTSKLGITLFYREERDQISFCFDFDSGLLQRQAIGFLAHSYRYLLHQALNCPELSVSDLETLTSYDTAALKVLCTGPVTALPVKTIQQIFVETCRHQPDEIAVYGQTTLTRGQLLKVASSVTAGLLQMSDRGSLIGVLLPPSAEYLVAVFGILMSGCAFLPLDPQAPMLRNRKILEQSGATVCITGSERLEGDFRCYPIQSFTDFCGEVECRGNLQDIAYCIFTSGSTGLPKGCGISQENALNYLLWAERYYVGKDKQCFAFFTSPAVDMTITSSLLPAAFGHPVVIYPQQADSICQAANDPRVTIIKATPSHLRMLNGVPLSPSMHKLIIGGEQLPSALAEQLSTAWNGNVEIYNEYGPTEATVGCMIYQYSSKDRWHAVPVGSAIENMRVMVMDSEDRMCLPGVIGELILEGRSVSHGYVTETGIAEKRFKRLSSGEWQYHSGDFGCLLADGTTLYRGRIDDQHKLNGYRVELLEIDLTTQEIPFVRQACAVLHTNNKGNKQLVLYCALDLETEHDELRLRRELFHRLPRYMMPSRIQILDSLPLSRNGKVDRAMLETYVLEEPALPQGAECEKFLVDCWQNTLGHSDFTMDDGFLEVGGDSLSIIALRERIAEKYPQVTVADLFCYPSIRTISEYLEGEKPAPARASIRQDTEAAIAVIGVAFSLPGACSLPDLRELLVEKKCMIGILSGQRRHDELVRMRNLGVDSKDCRLGMVAYLPEIDAFDNEYFRIGKDEADAMDPAHKLFMMMADRAYADAGLNKKDLRGRNMAVVAAQPTDIGFAEYTSRFYPSLSTAASLNRVSSSLVGRLQHFYDTAGPAYLMDCACSSGLAALHNACGMLSSGECEIALVGGVNLLDPIDQLGVPKAEVLSARYHANAFSDQADGTARGEGCICFVLQRLSDAKAMNYPVYAEISGSAMNNDGFSASVTAPNGLAQQNVIRNAWVAAGIQAGDLGLVETHGTATSLGDNIEFQSLYRVFDDNPAGQCALSAAKTVFGHTDTVSGLLGVLKCILSLHYHEIYPFIGMDAPNAGLDLINSPFYLAEEVRPWPENHNGTRICCVSSFGLSGTNVHLVLSQAETTPKKVMPVEERLHPQRCWLPEQPERKQVPCIAEVSQEHLIPQNLDEVLEELTAKVGQLFHDHAPATDMALYQSGFDSVSIIQLKLFIRNRYGLNLPVSSQDTLHALALQILEAGERPKADRIALTENVVHQHRPDSPHDDSWTNYQLREALTDFKAEYFARTRRSREGLLNPDLHWANGRFITGYTPGLEEFSYPVLAKSAQGAELWDIDGNHYIDFAMGFGANFFGYNHPVIAQSVADALQDGIILGALMKEPFYVAEEICRVTGLERASFCNSGTEAVMNLVRIARAATNRNQIVVFAGGFHGTFDPLYVQKNELGHSLHPLPRSMGTPIHYLDDIVMLPYGDEIGLEYVRAHGNELAAVLVEPVQSRHPALRPVEFVHSLRAVTEQCGALLIFDEVITGFRSGLGGAQAYYGTKADLVSYGKVIGGGFPIGVFGGKARYMDLIDRRGGLTGEANVDILVSTGGTFNGHPAAMATAKAVLAMLQKEGPELYARVNRMTEYLAEELNAFLQQEHRDISVEYFCSQFIFIGSQPQELRLLQYLLIHNGIYVWEGGTCFVSTQHTWEQIHTFVDTVKHCVGLVKIMLPEPDSIRVRVPDTLLPKSYPQLRQLVQKYPKVEEIRPLEPDEVAVMANNIAYRGKGLDISEIRIHLPFEVDTDQLEAGLNHIIAGSSRLRSGLSWRRLQQPVQLTWRTASCKVGVHPCTPDTLEETFSRIAAQRSRDGFVLEHAPLLGLELFLPGNGETEALLFFYNSWIDGWSTDLLLKRLLQAMKGEVTIPAEMDQNRYLCWRRTHEPTAREYWKKSLVGYQGAALTELQEGDWKEYILTLDEDAGRKIKDFAATYNSSEAAVYLVCMANAMGSHWLMTTISGRNTAVPGLLDAIGNFSALVPLAIPDGERPRQAKSLRETLETLNELPVFPLEQISQYSGVPIEKLNALVQTGTVVILNQPGQADTHAVRILKDQSYTRVPCRYYITPGTQLLITYHTKCLTQEQAETMAYRFLEQLDSL